MSMTASVSAQSLPPKVEGQLLADITGKLSWCRQCRVPLLTPVCHRCRGTGRPFLADAKPVFPDEKSLFEEVVGRPLPDHLYCHHNRVYFDGKLLFAIRVAEGTMSVKWDHTRELTAESVPQADRMAGWRAAVEANAPVLESLENEAIRSIAKVSEAHAERKPVVSFSGGKDSAVVAHLVLKAIGGQPDVSLFFGDTTLEHPETYWYVDHFAKQYGLALHTRRASGDFLRMCDDLEPPSRIMRWCCTVFKANPLNEFLQDNGPVLSFDGIRRRESPRRRDYQRLSGNKKAVKQLVFRPILDWSTMAVWLYIIAHDIPYNPAYDQGYARVGCLICPYSTDYNDVLTRRNHPDRVEAWEGVLTAYFKREYAGGYDPGRAEEWIRRGLWKQRKPHHRNAPSTTREASCPSLNQYTYRIRSAVDKSLLEFLRPLGRLWISPESGMFRVANADKFCITGVVGRDLLTVSLIEPRTRQKRFLVERQLKKAINCVQCGACAATCPSHAISIESGTSFQIDESLCTHCLACVRSDFTHYGCVALSYKSQRNWIVEG